MTHGSSVTTRVQSSSRQVPSAAGRVPQGEHLGMGGRVLEVLPLVVAPGDHLAPAKHDRADGHVAVDERGGGLGQRELHRGFVVHGGGSGIRTHGGLPHTRFPSVPIRPLSHPSRVGEATGRESGDDRSPSGPTDG